MRDRLRGVLAAFLVLLCAVTPSPAEAQDVEPSGPAFSVASSEIFTTRASPYIHLTFREITSLDFRVYRVNDPMRFFASLRDPHELGSPAPVVPEEQTWLERIAAWKASRRREIRNFVRRQFSPELRAARRQELDGQQVELRRTVGYTSFAQVPVLNRSQLVSAWREMLPPVREAEARRIPLELKGPGVYLVEAVDGPLKAYTVVIVSDVGLLTKAAPGQLLTYTANRFSGDPIADCHVQTLADQQTVATGATGPDGVFVTILEDRKPSDVIAVAQCGDQVAATDPGSWYFQEPARDLVGYIYTDKPIYRPGHTVRLKAILRWRTRGALIPFDRKQVEVVISDSSDKVLFRQPKPVDEFGAVLAEFPVPAGAALGYYSIRVDSDVQQANGNFEVQEYRKPEFEVTVTAADGAGARFMVQGATATATITAKYYFGQPVANGAVKYAVFRSPYYSPFRWTDDADEDQPEWYGDGDQESEGTARLDAQGTARISIPLPEDEQDRDYSYRIEARVTDASNREVSGRGSVNATVGTFMLSSTTDRYVYRPGTPAELRVRAVDYVGAPQPNLSINVWLERLTYPNGRYQDPEATKIAESVVDTDAEGRAVWTTTLSNAAGDYRFRASASSGDRAVQDDARIWVPGRQEGTAGADEDQRFLELVADKRTYAPGDTARVIIRGEEFESSVLITKESQYVSYHHVVRARANEAVDVPITADDIGDTYVSIAFLKDDRLYTAERRLGVPATSRQLNVTITSDKDVAKPGQQSVVTVRTVDDAGLPVRAQVSLAVIDEAVYGVKPDATPDPLRFFYRREYSRVGTQFSREYSFVGYSGTQQLQLAQRRRPFSLADFKGDRPERPQVRKEFPDAIHWVGNLVTGADGTAAATITYPDALTTWRFTARAVSPDTHVGGGIARTLTTKDLILRVITPRFLTQGDEVAVPTVVHNYLPDAQPVALSITASGLTAASPDAPQQTVTIPSNGEHRIDWRFRADRTGTASVKGTATTPVEGDAVELSLPVLPYGLKREAGHAGSITAAGEQSAELTMPEASNPDARTIRVSLAPSLAGSIFGALDYLTSFPYGCTEQILSSFVPNLIVSRTLTQLKLPAPERLRGLDRQISDGLKRLYDYQHEDGGWGWWKTDQNHPFMTAYAVSGLLDVQAAGYNVDSWRITNGSSALFRLYREYPRAVPDLKAYMGYVLARTTARNITPEAPSDGTPFSLATLLDELWPRRSDMSPYGQALLLLALDSAKDARGDQLARDLLAGVKTTGDLSWWETGDDPLLEDSVNVSVEATALAVKALVARERQNPVLERAIRWLMLNRNAGVYWSSTKQTAMVLSGVLEYLASRGETPDQYTVDVLVNGQPAGSHTFTVADWTKADPIEITAAGRVGANQIRIVKKGAGTVYWSAVAQYYYNGGTLEPTGSRKLALTRQYFTLTPIQTRGRIRYRQAPFTGTAAPGDLLLVRLTAAGSSEWRYLMIEDPLPAGAETIQQEDLYQLEAPVRRYYESRREYRDDRVAVFQESLRDGRAEFSYLLKIVTPGQFRAMPAQITPMYVPGVSASTEAQPVNVGREVAAASTASAAGAPAGSAARPR